MGDAAGDCVVAKVNRLLSLVVSPVCHLCGVDSWRYRIDGRLLLVVGFVIGIVVGVEIHG